MMSTLSSIQQHCSEWVIEYLPAVFSALSSMMISFFMGIYDGKPVMKIVSGPFICGIFTLAISGSLEHLGMPENGVNLIGGVIGFVGVEKLRELIEGNLNRRLGREK